MSDPVLSVLDKGVPPKDFGELCLGILGRLGYSALVPFGPMHKGLGPDGTVIFFRFLPERLWEPPLKECLKQLPASDARVHRIVVITGQAVDAAARERLEQLILKTYGWTLTLHDRDWVRAHVDRPLSRQHLKIEPEPPAMILPEFESTDGSRGVAWDLLMSGDYEEALPEFKKWLVDHDRHAEGWAALAWCLFGLGRTQEALITADKALQLDAGSRPAKSLRALAAAQSAAESGLERKLLEARDLLGRVALGTKDWRAHYNFANALLALGQYDQAKREYRQARVSAPEEATILENLAVAHQALGETAEELRAYEQALMINPDLTEIQLARGLRLLQLGQNVKTAVGQVEEALKNDQSLASPSVLTALAGGYLSLGNVAAALGHAQEGLKGSPEHAPLAALRTRALSRLWRKDPSSRPAARGALYAQYRSQPSDTSALVELVELMIAEKNADGAWKLLDGVYPDGAGHLKRHGYETKNCVASLRFRAVYLAYRHEYPMKNYVEQLQASGVKLSDDWVNGLTVVGAAVFGNGCELIARIPPEGRTLEALKRLEAFIGGRFRQILPAISEELLPEIKGTRKEALRLLSAVVAATSNLALWELGRQVLFIAEVFNVDKATLKAYKADPGSSHNSFQEVMSETLAALERKLQLFKRRGGDSGAEG